MTHSVVKIGSSLLLTFVLYFFFFHRTPSHNIVLPLRCRWCCFNVHVANEKCSHIVLQRCCAYAKKTIILTIILCHPLHPITVRFFILFLVIDRRNVSLIDSGRRTRFDWFLPNCFARRITFTDKNTPTGIRYEFREIFHNVFRLTIWWKIPLCPIVTPNGR